MGLGGIGGGATAAGEGPRLVGRESEIALLRAAADRAASGHASFVLVAGEPGIGKTALASEVAAHAESAGGVTLWGPCWEGEGAPAYWPWSQVLRAYARGRRTDDLLADMGEGAADIARIAPEIGGRFLALSSDADVDPEQARFRLFDHIAAFLRASAERQPLVIVLDDLHWADRSSLMLLRFAVQTMRDARMLVIGTYRDVEITSDHPFIQTVGDLTLERITLSGLPRAHVATLMAVTTGAEPSEDLAEVISGRTSGNPFFVKEVTRLLAAQGKLGQHGTAAASAIPLGVGDVIRRRLARLTQECADLLGAASVLGPEFAIDLLADLQRSSVSDVLALLDDAVSARLVTEGGDVAGRFAFAHSLVREVIYDGLGATRRSMLHWRTGELLEQRPGASLTEIATHLVQGVASGHAAKAAALAIRAARSALAMYAWDQGVTLYERALDVLPAADADVELRLRTMLELGDARTAAGDLTHARAMYEKAATMAAERGLATELAHAALGFGGGLGGFEVPLFNDRQMELLQRAIDALPDEDSAVRAWVLARLSVASSYVRSIEERARLSNEAVSMARRIGDDGALSYALSSLCDAMSGPDHIGERIAASTTMIALSEQPSSGVARCGVASCAVCLCNPEFALLGRRLRVVANLEVGGVQAVDEDIDAYTRLAEHLRQPLYLWYSPVFKAMRALMRGNFGDADRFLDEATALGRRTSSENAAIVLAVQRAGIAFERGDLAEAQRSWRAMGEMTPDVLKVPSSSGMSVLMQGLFGDVSTAGPVLQRWADEGGLTSQPKDSEWIPTAAYFAEAALRTRETQPAEHIYGELAPYASEFVVDAIAARFMGSVSYYLGRLATLLRRFDNAESHLQHAIESHERTRAVVWLARSRLELARMLALSDDSRVALRGKLARAAAATFTEVGLDGSVAEAAAIAEGTPVGAITEDNAFRNEGEYWTVSFAGTIARLKDSKGLRDIAVLLGSPNREIAAVDLIARDGGVVARAVGSGADAGEILDEQARAAYKERILQLRDDIEDAELNNDPTRAGRAREELDALTEQLAGAYGLGGRARKAGDPAERARKAVSERIRDAVAKLAKEHPALHRHFKASIRTGAFCSYMPERPVTWSF